MIDLGIWLALVAVITAFVLTVEAVVDDRRAIRIEVESDEVRTHSRR